jgi:hypothetical protein
MDKGEQRALPDNSGSGSAYADFIVPAWGSRRLERAFAAAAPCKKLMPPSLKESQEEQDREPFPYNRMGEAEGRGEAHTNAEKGDQANEIHKEDGDDSQRCSAQS